MFGVSARRALLSRLFGHDPQSAPQPAAPQPPQADPRVAGLVPAQFAAPAAAAAPQAPAPDEDAAVDVVAQRPRAYDGPLAMDASAQRYQAQKPGFWDRLAMAGSALSEGPSAAADMRRTWNADKRADWERGQQASSRQTAIEAVRRVIDREGDNNPELMRVAQMAGTPEAFLEWYAKWKETTADRALATRQVDINERQGDRRLDQGDSELDLNRELGRGQLGVARMNAQTARLAQQDASPGKDPLERGMIANDVDQLQKFAEANSTLAGLLPDLAAFTAANEREQGTGGGSFASWSPFVNQDTEEMRAITARLAPALRQAGSGSMSDKDMEFLLQQVPNTGRSQKANVEVAARFRMASQRAAERERYGREYIRRDRSLENFNRLWSAYINEASIAAGDQRSFSQWVADKQRQMQQGAQR